MGFSSREGFVISEGPEMLKPKLFLVALVFGWMGLMAGIQAEEDGLKAVLKLEDLEALAKRNPEAELYRLTVNRSFDPVLVFEIDKDAIFLKKARRIQEEIFHVSFRLVRDSRIPLEGEEYASFGMLVKASSFWKLPTEDWMPPGLDGSSWVLEGVKEGKYHRVERGNLFYNADVLQLDEEMGRLSPGRLYSEGRLAALFTYIWALSGDTTGELY